MGSAEVVGRADEPHAGLQGVPVVDAGAGAAQAFVWPLPQDQSPAGLLAAFLDATSGAPLSMLDRAVARRAADRSLTAAEVDLLDAAAALITATTLR